MTSEIESLHKKEAWNLVEFPQGKKVIKCKWVFRQKEAISKKHGEKFKTQLITNECTQRKGIIYDEIFSPIETHTSIWIELGHIVVKIAFLHGELEEQIYMQYPNRFAKLGIEHLVCRLSKLLYGPKQSPKRWYKLLDSYMIQIG